MIQYEKKYEDYYKDKKEFALQLTSQKPVFPRGMSKEQFIKNLDTMAHETSRVMFDIYVKYVWSLKALRYRKGHKIMDSGSLITRWRRFFHMEEVGHDYSYIAESNYYWLASYIKAWFPTLENDDPFTNADKFKYPYKHVTFEYLFIVYQMPQRFEFLEMAEKQKMPYRPFVNYVINWALCHNDAMGRQIFSVKVGNWRDMPYIKNHY